MVEAASAAPGGLARLRLITLVTGDLPSAQAFYQESFGFEPISSHEQGGPAFAQLVGLPGARASSIHLRLGRQELELQAFQPRGQVYPEPRSSADPWFQHFAIVVSDMERAYAELVRQARMLPISAGGPQRLPPNTGSVTAYKMRDPEGHPLELSMFPPGVGASRWHEPGEARTFLGVDHSASGVRDIATSLAFYTGLLGLQVSGRTVNRGPEQARLDGLHSDGVNIVALQPRDPDSPHLELLGYQVANRPEPRHWAVNDFASTRLSFEADDLDGLIARLQSEGATFVSPALVTLDDGARAALIRDPDGHLLELRSPSGEPPR